MSGPDADAIGPLKRKDGEPVFDEPWQAQVLAMADVLVQRGAFTPVEWSDTLGEELRRAERAHSPDEATTHYQAALGALVFGVVQQGLFFSGAESSLFRVFLGTILIMAVILNTYIRRMITGER